MADALPSAGCCQPSSCENTTTNIPGPQGPPGPAGANGTNGVNAYTKTGAALPVPPYGNSGNCNFLDTSWMGSSQIIFIASFGYFRVNSILSATLANLFNLGYAGNIGGGNFSVGASVSPGGIKGVDGSVSGVAGGDLTGNYPNPKVGITTTKGQIIVSVGGGIGHNTSLNPGPDGTRLVAESGAATGLNWTKVDVSDATQITGALKVDNGGTGLNAGVSGGIPAYTAVNTIASSALLAQYAPMIGGGVGAVPKTIAVGAGTAGQVLTSAGAAAEPVWSTSSASGSPKDVVYLQETQAAGVNGGTFGSGAWTQRPINLEVVDTAGICAVAAGQFTLAAGTYRYRSRCPGMQVDRHKARLWNVTAGSAVATGSNARADAAAGTCTDSWVEGRFTIGAAQAFELQHICETTKANVGFGQAFNQGVAEVYSEIWLEREVP